MGSFFGGIVGGIIAKVIGWLALIGIGKKEQAAADTKASLKDAQDARKIDNHVDGESDAAVADELDQFVRKPTAKP